MKLITAKARVRPEVIAKYKGKLRDKQKALEPRTISIGIHEDDGAEQAVGYDGKPSNISILELALIHELGRGNVPDRSFLRTWFDQNESKFKREMRVAARVEFLNGGKGAIEQQAARWTADFVEWMKRNGAGLDPLQPATEAARERAGLPPGPPLVATEQLIKAIVMKIEEG